MKIKFYSFARLFLLVTVFATSCKKDLKTSESQTNSSESTIKRSLTDYQLVWSDEFNYTGLPDTSKWINEIGHVRGTELQYYTNRIENQSVYDGQLHIIAKKEIFGGYNYTSASINTQGKYSVQYGRIEARIKLPMFTGEFPAFWTLGDNPYPWPSDGEIDIMEQLNTESLIYGTTHWDNNANLSSSWFTITTPGEYHIYAVEWDANSIKWYVDNNLYKTQDIAGAPNGTWELHQPQYLLLNMAVGGDWPGHTVDDSKLPGTMYVDYVRVYQKILLFNSGFESGAISPWAAWNPSGGGTSVISNTNARTGTYAIKEQGGQTSLEQTITGLLPNTTYTFGGYGKVSTAGQSAVIGVKNYGGSAKDTQITNTAYQNGSVTFKTGTTNTSATVYFYKPNSGTAYGDDFYLTKQ